MTTKRTHTRTDDLMMGDLPASESPVVQRKRTRQIAALPSSVAGSTNDRINKRTAKQVLTAVVNKQIAKGSPVVVEKLNAQESDLIARRRAVIAERHSLTKPLPPVITRDEEARLEVTVNRVTKPAPRTAPAHSAPVNSQEVPTMAPKSRTTKKPVLKSKDLHPCLCGCGERCLGTFRQGHDARLRGMLLRGEVRSPSAPMLEFARRHGVKLGANKPAPKAKAPAKKK